MEFQIISIPPFVMYEVEIQDFLNLGHNIECHTVLHYQTILIFYQQFTLRVVKILITFSLKIRNYLLVRYLTFNILYSPQIELEFINII